MSQQRMNTRSVGGALQTKRVHEAGEAMMTESASGHRQRLKARFLAETPDSQTETVLLELLLTYAIPQRDVRPLAERVLAHFGTLDAVIGADTAALCAVEGIAEHTAVLLKLCGSLRSRSTPHDVAIPQQMPLLEPEVVSEPDAIDDTTTLTAPAATPRRVAPDRGSDLVTKSLLRDAVAILPRLPDTESLDETAAFLRANLRFSAVQTRERYAAYINRRMFPHGIADRALRRFAAAFAGQQELRDVAFYRFCLVEPLIGRVVHDLLLPAIGAGELSRHDLRAYLVEHYPESRSIPDAMNAITETLDASGFVRADRNRLSFGYRSVLLPSFAFILHSEFAEPGSYPLQQFERHPVLKTMLWKPDAVMTALYELRNQGLITRISQIDSLRQFTLRYDLDGVTPQLTSAGVAA